MIRLDLLPKVLCKPREAFEELRGSVGWEDGIVLYVVLSVVALVLAGIMVQVTGINILPIAFGFGNVIVVESMLILFFIGIVDFILLAVVVNFLALKVGGSGNFSELLGMFGYTKFLSVLQALASSVMLAWVYSAGVAAAARAIQGDMSPPSFVALGVVTLILTVVFSIWSIILYSAAASRSHGISMFKGFACVLGTVALFGAVSYGLMIFTGVIR